MHKTQSFFRQLFCLNLECELLTLSKVLLVGYQSRRCYRIQHVLALIDYYVCQANKPPHNRIKLGTRTNLNETIRKCSCNVGFYKETFVQIFFMNTGIRSHFSVLAFSMHFGFFVCSKLLKKSFLKRELLSPFNCSKMHASCYFIFDGGFTQVS